MAKSKGKKSRAKKAAEPVPVKAPEPVPEQIVSTSKEPHRERLYGGKGAPEARDAFYALGFIWKKTEILLEKAAQPGTYRDLGSVYGSIAQYGARGLKVISMGAARYLGAAARKLEDLFKS